MKELIYNYMFFFASNSDDNFAYGNDYIAQFSYVVILAIIISTIISCSIFYLFLNKGLRTNDTMRMWWTWGFISTVLSIIAVIFILQTESLQAGLSPIYFEEFDFLVIPLYLFHVGKWSFIFYTLLSFVFRLGSDNASHLPDFKTKNS